VVHAVKANNCLHGGYQSSFQVAHVLNGCRWIFGSCTCWARVKDRFLICWWCSPKLDSHRVVALATRLRSR
jgi:hypothetical protein